MPLGVLEGPLLRMQPGNRCQNRVSSSISEGQIIPRSSGTVFLPKAFGDALMPVVGLQVLHLEPANLGFLFTSMAVGSVVTAIFIIPWARSRYSPQRLMTYANASLIAVCLLMGDYPLVGRSLVRAKHPELAPRTTFTPACLCRTSNKLRGSRLKQSVITSATAVPTQPAFTPRWT